MKITELLKTKRLYFDGGTGTVLQSRGLAGGEPPEKWTFSHPDEILSLHRAYVDAGCNIVKTNTFGVNSDKYPNYEEYFSRGVALAEKAAQGREDVFVALDIGPTGRLLKPLGDLGFEEAVSIFADSARCAEKYGADLILIETMNDLYETKAALLAAKENSSLPVFVTNAYDETSRLMTGATPEAVIATLEGLGADAIGLNCSFGPDKMEEIVKKYVSRSSVPVIVNPNAGLPREENGRTVYDIDASLFAEKMKRIASFGAHIIGGCCGTDPGYIRKTVEATKDVPYIYPSEKELTVISSYTHALDFDKRPLLIGERINPTGKKNVKEALREGDLSFILSEGLKQAEKGAHVLDVNVGLPEIDEKEMMKKVVSSLQEVTDLPLQIDSSDPYALEEGARIYNGKPLLNSVNGKEESMEKVFPVAKKYGGAIIALTLDEYGIPSSPNGRLAIAEKIEKKALEYGIGRNELIFDPLCLTVASDKDAARVTLESVRLLKENGYKTSLGISNVSFGLPAREKLNMTFFALALGNGLDCAIMNPYSREMTDVYNAFCALSGYDDNFEQYIAYSENNASPVPAGIPAEGFSLKKLVISGMKKEAAEKAKSELENKNGLDLINGEIIPALNEVGRDFEAKKVYLPRLIMSAEAASAAFEVIKRSFDLSKTDDSKRVILATVKGDIHDIGKNIVKVLLESYSFKVYDLGRDVDPETVLSCVKETGCFLVGLSALMTTTLPSMRETIELLHSYDKNIKVVVGGAVLTPEYAESIGADFYAKEATDTVKYADKFYS